MEISRVETEREIEGFGGGGVPAEIVEIVGAIVRAVRIDTDENPARVPPTRVEARCCGFAGAGLCGGGAGVGFDDGAFLAGCGFGAGCCFCDSRSRSFSFSFSFSLSFSFFGFADGRALRSLPCR